MAGPVRIDVRNGAVTSRVYVATGATVDPKWADLFPTIDGLFVMIDGASERGETVEAAYDAHYGYPHRIAIDREHWEVDGGANIVVDDFRPL